MKHSNRVLQMFRISAAAVMATGAALAQTPGTPPVKVACIGDSITQGSGAEKGKSYPSQLQALLGPAWKVGNFGVSGRTLLKKGDFPYWNEKAYENALAFKPDIVIIMLGTNDSKPHNWVHKEEFVPDYRELVKSFQALETTPRIFVCRPCPVPEPGNWGINETNVKQEIEWIDALAADRKLGMIDMHAALAGLPEFLPDRVHPNTDGAAEMAKAAFKALAGGERGAIAKSAWHGRDQETFTLAGRSCQVVLPAKPLPGKPWIWRPEFFEAFNQADLALLEQGYHLAYKLNPIDNLQAIAAAHIPILSVCGDADTAVPYAENTAIVKERYTALGGRMEVIMKPGVGHHPHSLPDPAPIVRFVRSANEK